MIVARVRAGEKQVDLAREFGISKGYLSKIIKQSKPKGDAPAAETLKDFDYSDTSNENLANRVYDIQREFREITDELQSRDDEIRSLRSRIKEETQKKQDFHDHEWLLSQQRRIAWLESTRRAGFKLALLHKEMSQIMHVLAKRNAPELLTIL